MGADAARGAPVGSPRLFVLTDDPAAAFVATDSDGSRRIIAHGLRFVERPDGSIQRASELLPPVGSVHPLELPPRLGGGYLFWLQSSGSTSFWTAATFAGHLRPLATLEFEASRVVAGFDRLYIGEKSSNDVVALDAKSGQVLDIGPLPAAPSYGALAFADAWLGAVEVPLRGVLVSFDAGASWRPPPGQATGVVDLEDGRIVITTASGKRTLDTSGVLLPYGRDGSDDALFEGAAGLSPVEAAADVDDEAKTPPLPVERHPLRIAALHGWPDSADTAVIARDGALSRVRLADGAVLSTAPHAFTGSTCHAVPLEDRFGFVCGDERGATTIYRFAPPLALDAVLSFDDPRFVAASGNGALVVRGACRGSAGTRAGETLYCIRDVRGRVREVVVRGDRGVERVVALRDGRVAVLVPPRLGAAGRLNFVAPDASVRGVALELPRAEPALRALLEKGLWLDGVIERNDGELAAWVAGAGPFVGVRIRSNGRVRAGRVENDVDRALFSGELALVTEPSGKEGMAEETLDGGFHWRELDLPRRSDAARGPRLPRGRERGCSRVGCAFDSLVRIGWLVDSHERPLEVAVAPKVAPRRSPGGGAWRVTCAPTGEVSRVPLPRAETRVRPRIGLRRALPAVDELESSAWSPFLERAAPSRATDELGFDAGTENDQVRMHGYVWGRRGASWDRAGRWQIHAADRFAVDGVWSSAVSRSPWKDPVQAAQDFGHEVAGQPVIWKALIEPSGRAGVLRINMGSRSDLYLFEEGKSVARVENLAAYGLATLAGAVKVENTWYVGSASGSQLRILVIDGHRVTRAFDYPQRMSGRTASVFPTLVRSARADAVGIWTRGSSWYVHTVELDTGALSEPLVIDAPAFAQMPPPCSVDTDGFVLEGPPGGVEPYIDFVDAAGAPRLMKIEARLVASPLGMCTESLAAVSEGEAPDKASKSASRWSGRPNVPMTLSDRRPGGRRWGFRCGR
jgi:hypothetical protein